MQSGSDKSKQLKSVMEPETVYIKLLADFKLAYKPYEYIQLSDGEFKRLAIALIKRLPKITHITSEYKRSAVSMIQCLFDEVIKQKLKGQDQAFNLINSYINFDIKLSSNSKEAQKQLEKLSSFFSKYNYTPDPDLLGMLVKENNVVSSLLDIIVQENISGIERGTIVFYDEVLPI